MLEFRDIVGIGVIAILVAAQLFNSRNPLLFIGAIGGLVWYALY